MTAHLVQPATYADLEKVPPNCEVELIGHAPVEVLLAPPRHSMACAILAAQLGNQPVLGGMLTDQWQVRQNPRISLNGYFCEPDLAGWRLTPQDLLSRTAIQEAAPNWICEVIAPDTVRDDRGRKRELYARAGVRFLWLLDPIEQSLEVFDLVGTQWRLIDTVICSEAVSLPPFDAISFPLSILFPFDAPKSSEPMPES